MKNMFVGIVAFAVLICGCQSPEEISGGEGLNGEHVRAAAQAMSASLLNCRALVAKGPGAVVKISKIEDSTRFMIDANIFLHRFRAKLNEVSCGRLRFLDSSASVADERMRILRERQRQQMQYDLRQMAGYIMKSTELRGRSAAVAIMPPLNTNLVGMDATGFMNLLREEMVRVGQERIKFLAPGETEGADYWLTGEFYPVEGGKIGKINMAEYLEILGNRMKEGRSVFIERDRTPEAMANPREAALLRLLDAAHLQETPNSDLRLNVMLSKAGEPVVVFETGTQVRQKITDNSSSADFVLSGEISELPNRRRGISSEYVLLSFKLVDPESNVICWEGTYEVEYVFKEGVVYR